MSQPTCPTCDAEWTRHLLVREELKHELEQTRADAAKVVHALDAAIQLTEALIAWWPAGTPMDPSVAGAKRTLDAAMDAIRTREPR